VALALGLLMSLMVAEACYQRFIFTRRTFIGSLDRQRNWEVMPFRPTD
jgi:hypothetical protein